ncbi:hypothetical protein CC85DRAFT_289036 [Cutaneotrichosporon oleaginosum]|uniref:Uncharacterized protein n=1 Tax=Cutaneotrichosporon oleaginosum TaxID=879819 RepID=A0A0J1AUK7_9TREE|nr:uncharacterized protein CC85DRAFT_289036 [Cutaneotrichosporon oleaginosum]KLT38959.1 hypothetical protein CC85DRAFT_289036 [Cutaneotrichosporon oleaginosum]
MSDQQPARISQAVLDHKAFPHIYEAILGAAPSASLLRLRLVSRSLRDWVDSRLAPDVTIAYVSVARGVRVRSRTGFAPHFPTPVLRRSQAAEWPSSASRFFSRVFAHTTTVDLGEVFPPTGLHPLPSFLTHVQTLRMAVSRDGWSEAPRPPDLSGPITAPEIILLGPTSWSTMPGLRIPHGVRRLVLNSPLHSPMIQVDNVGRPADLATAVFLFDARHELDRADPDFALKQQHQALMYSVAGMLAAAPKMHVTLVNIHALSPMTLGIAPAEMGGRGVEDVFAERVRVQVIRQLGEVDLAGLEFMTLEEYAATRTPEQLALELGEPL